MAFGLIPKAGLLYFFGLHRQSWHKVGVRDLYRLGAVLAIWTVPVYLLNFVLSGWTLVPRSVPLIEGVLAALALGGLRLNRGMAICRKQPKYGHLQGKILLNCLLF